VGSYSAPSRRPFAEAPGVAFVVHLEDLVLHDAEKDDAGLFASGGQPHVGNREPEA